MSKKTPRSSDPKETSSKSVSAVGAALTAEVAFNLKQTGTPGSGSKKVRTFFAIRAATAVFPADLRMVGLAHPATDWELAPKKTLSGGKALLIQAKKIRASARDAYADDTLNLDVTVSNSGVVIGTVSISATVFNDTPWE